MMEKFLFVLVAVGVGCALGETERWSAAKANAWYAGRAWPVGSNFIPSTAINQIEMFNAATFDPATIDRELGWAEALGFNTMRVFLHSIPYHEDPEGFLGRLDAYLALSAKHGISTLVVLLDSVWDPFPHAGTQRAPIQWLHNSGWVQCPGFTVARNRSLWEPHVGTYIRGVVSRFKDDARIFGWDIWNGMGAVSLLLLWLLVQTDSVSLTNICSSLQSQTTVTIQATKHMATTTS